MPKLTPDYEHDPARLFRAVVRAMSEGVVIHSADGAIISANAAAEEILGISLEQMTGRTSLDERWGLVKLDGSPMPPGNIPSEITQRTGKACHAVRLGVNRANGERRWLSVSTTPLLDDNGEPNGVVAMFSDISRELEAQWASEESQAQLTSVIESLPEGAYQYITRDDGTDAFMFASEQSGRLFGLSVADMLANSGSVWERVVESQIPALQAAIAHSAQGLEQFEAEFQYDHPETGRRWLRALSVPERRDDGVVFTGIIADITDAKRMEERMRSVQRREAMAELSSGVAHNFNNLLGAIIPNLDMALEDAKEEQRPMLEDARSAAESAAELVAQLLRLGRPPKGGSQAVCSLATCVDETMVLCRSTFDRIITINTSIQAHAPWVGLHRADCQQVLFNLCLNARDALKGRPHPTLEVVVKEASLSNQPAIELIVRDNGHGMRSEEAARLGEPFFTTKEPGMGTGLGLASVYRIVGEAKGVIEVQTAVGEGTTFSVALPRVRSPRGDAAQARASTAALTGRRVLLVDDEVLIRRAVAKALTVAGCDVVAMPEAASAMEALAEPGAHFDVAVLDLSMPGMSGDEFRRWLAVHHPELPVIIASGFVERVELPPEVPVLRKPFSVEQLLGIFADILED